MSLASKIALVGIAFVVAMIGGAVWAVLTDDEGAAEPTASEPVTVEIAEGSGASEVADTLAEAGVIDRAWQFSLIARIDGRGGQIRPGEYELEPGASTGELLDVLASGPPLPDSFRVTIPEGLTVEQILERVASADGSPFEVEELEEALVGVPLPEWVPTEELPEGAQLYEGLLFPATYEHFVDVDAQTVLAEMLTATGEALDAVEVPEGRSRYEILTIASLIEREVRVDGERELVSSVIANRLADSMRLQIDASVQYAQGEHQDRLLFDDLRIDSAWNTYESDGLPPTPIASPGRAAIEAAADPADTDYRFYVVCDTATGEHEFAETSEAHDANVARYREIQEEGGRVCGE